LSWKGWQVLCWVGAGRAWTWSCWPVVKAEEFQSVKPQLNNIFMACNTMIEKNYETLYLIYFAAI
jgi:hypothetical protein